MVLYADIEYMNNEEKLNSPREHQVIVSLTCISKRIPYILPVINSLRNQTMQPDKIILWLSKDKYLYDQGVPYKKIPRNIRKLAESADNNFEIHYTENTGPFRKLLPALKKFNSSEDIIVTADDDIIYPEYWLDSLYKAFLKNKCITCFRARKILFDDKNNLKPYSTWPVLDHLDSRKELFLCPTGNNGILYSPEFFDERIFNPIFRKICPSRCDIWFLVSALANQVLTKQIIAKTDNVDKLKVKHSRFPQLWPAPVLFFKRYRKIEWPQLWHYNKTLNDNIINAVFEYYSI